ncbi:PP2C family serine/threonine-protein phosphatase [Microcella sp.]|uniref:PP2C family serine/threonine-protein phosphatase n=1 Tax=Microcella sp. TaxID=1913979 RepID=UPI00391B3856
MARSVTTGGWRSFGVSVIGPGHVSTGKPNQDAWASFHHPWGDGVVVSDGLGSKQHSDWGSAAACRAVETAAFALSRQTLDDGPATANFLARVRDEWVRAIEPLDPRDSSATCIFAVADGENRLRIGLLGDGAVVAVMRDGSVAALTDDKSGGFSNMTSALSPNATAESWQISTIPATECVAVVLCTDGISDDLEDLAGFAKEFIKSFGDMPALAASRQIHEVLMNWPVPKHSDDKTLACLVREVRADD